MVEVLYRYTRDGVKDILANYFMLTGIPNDSCLSGEVRNPFYKMDDDPHSILSKIDMDRAIHSLAPYKGWMNYCQDADGLFDNWHEILKKLSEEQRAVLQVYVQDSLPYGRSFVIWPELQSEADWALSKMLRFLNGVKDRVVV